MKNIRIAVLGMNQGYKFAKDAINIPDIELVAVAGNDELAQIRAKELNVPLYTDYKALIENCKLDGIIITLPNALHREAVELAARKKLHVLVEKPIAHTVEDGEAIIKICKENNVSLLVGHHRRFSSKLTKLREIVSSNKIGQTVGVNMMFVLAKDRPYFSEKWRLTQSGGPLLINGIHDIDVLRFVTGLTIQSVYAVKRNNIRQNPVEDSASVLLETREGPIANYFLSDGVPSPWSYELTTNENPKYSHSDADCYQIFGTKGSISFPSLTLYTYDEEHFGWDHPLKVEKLEVEDNDPMTAELLHFASIIRGDAEPFVTGEDALETLKVINAIQLSADSRQKIEVNAKKTPTSTI
ncbi:Gfo/Idh/MocA family protein [Robertmurraya andreesenii]|uniref:Dehydrogenase n=1 Tax=Anoxybacillus andreesenii TaxID=1325932 RepID=A0ABT9V898_9BACL|nr:Gfo/Idh/MocA family oxidoreductase [Robertmurraya andreesenii]MDQ0157179.1 putative dehydrogenase [Robertmurraya andreesenii]